MVLDAVIIAGGDPGKDAQLLAHAGGAPCKALIQLGGQTFLQHIVAAMIESERVRRIVVVGIPSELRPDLGSQVVFLPDAHGMLANGRAGIEYFRSTGGSSARILSSSGDIPLITPEVVSDFVDLCLPHDVDYCYPIVPEEAMERVFPGSGRTFVPLASGRFAGGDLGMVKPTVLDSNTIKIEELIGQRKTFWRQVRAVGFDTLFLLLVRRLTIAQLERRASRAIGITGKAILCPHAEVAMDVDKPHHLDVVRAAFARREQKEPAG